MAIVLIIPKLVESTFPAMYQCHIVNAKMPLVIAAHGHENPLTLRSETTAYWNRC